MDEEDEAGMRRRRRRSVIRRKPLEIRGNKAMITIAKTATTRTIARVVDNSGDSQTILTSTGEPGQNGVSKEDLGMETCGNPDSADARHARRRAMSIYSREQGQSCQVQDCEEVNPDHAGSLIGPINVYSLRTRPGRETDADDACSRSGSICDLDITGPEVIIMMSE